MKGFIAVQYTKGPFVQMLQERSSFINDFQFTFQFVIDGIIGIEDSNDNCFQPNPDQKDTDGDNIGDVCDLTP